MPPYRERRPWLCPLAIVASGCLAAIRWRSSASASSVQRHRFLVVTAGSRVQVPGVLARLGNEVSK